MRLAVLARRGLAVALSAILLAGCASGPKIYVNEDPAASFEGYGTYAFEPQLGTDRPGYTSILSQYLKTAVTRELNSRGYRQVSNGADLTVNFYVHTAEKIQTTQTTTHGGYYGYRRGYYGAYRGYPSTQTEVRQYTEGTLTIDLVDTRSDQLVWEGTAVGRIRESVRENLQASVDGVVSEIFTRYPYIAAGSL